MIRLILGFADGKKNSPPEVLYCGNDGNESQMIVDAGVPEGLKLLEVYHLGQPMKRRRAVSPEEEKRAEEAEETLADLRGEDPAEDGPSEESDGEEESGPE